MKPTFSSETPINVVSKLFFGEKPKGGRVCLSFSPSVRQRGVSRFGWDERAASPPAAPAPHPPHLGGERDAHGEMAPGGKTGRRGPDLGSRERVEAVVVLTAAQGPSVPISSRDAFFFFFSPALQLSRL